MLLLEDINKFAVENLQRCDVQPNGMNWVARCPFCGDSKKNKFKRRFHLKYESDESVYYHCFNCGEAGSFYKLYAFVKGISEEDAVREFRKFDPNQIKKRFTQTITKIVAKKKELKNLDWILEDCIPSNPPTSKENRLREAWKKWEVSRKISGTFVALRGDFANRVIIPVYENGSIVYFQGRTLVGAEPKYLNPIVEKSNIIFNKELFNPEKYIIVAEGLLDAKSIEDNQGTTCLGASITDDFLTELYKYSRKGIIIALDNDSTGIKELKKLLKYSKYNNQLRYFLMPDKSVKDLNELKVNTDINIYDYVVSNSYDSFKTSMLLKFQ